MRVINAKWNEKMKQVVDINDPSSKRQLDALHDVAERFRNTYSHGAFGHRGEAAMFVQLPDSDAVPATLGEFGVRPELWFVPAVKDDFHLICAVFDSCDEWLANGPLADGYKWIVEGVNFRFDEAFRVAASYRP